LAMLPPRYVIVCVLNFAYIARFIFMDIKFNTDSCTNQCCWGYGSARNQHFLPTPDPIFWRFRFRNLIFLVGINTGILLKQRNLTILIVDYFFVWQYFFF
jgi:hypothetical protein